MVNFSTRAQPPLEFIPPSFNPLVLRFCQMLLPLGLKFGTNIKEIEAKEVETLAELFSQFQAGKIRLMMAFRHPSTDDPLCMAHLLWRSVSKTARQKGISLPSTVHAHFIYDRGIPLWTGSFVGWLYSRLGGSSMRRGKIDILGLRSARRLFAESSLPIAVAPEGATNGHNEIVSPLEPGIAQLGFWCLEDLLRAERSQEVIILPIGIQYRYLTSPWQQIEQLLAQLEKESGWSTPSVETAHLQSSQQEAQLTSTQVALYQRLYGLGEHLLSLMENFYTEFYHQTLPEVEVENATDKNGLLSKKLQNLLDVALKVGEQYFYIKPKGNLIDRCRRLEQAGWDCIYREELLPNKNLSSVERGLANLIAEEASLRMWHMRLVESFVAVTGYYVKEKPSASRFAEMALLLWELVKKIKGESPFPRPQLGQERAILTVGKPISVNDRWQSYRSSRRQAVAQLTQDLQTALEEMIVRE